MKFKAGDRVRVLENAREVEYYPSEMQNLAGKIITIDKVDVYEDEELPYYSEGWWWSEETLELVEDDTVRKYITNDILLGMELNKLSQGYQFKDVVKFLKGDAESCLSFDCLKPLYDRYGYDKVNSCILELERLNKWLN